MDDCDLSSCLCQSNFLNDINSFMTLMPSPPIDRVTLTQIMMTLIHPVEWEIISLVHAESEGNARLLERTEVE
jgi:hypothetical protein